MACHVEITAKQSIPPSTLAKTINIKEIEFGSIRVSKGNPNLMMSKLSSSKIPLGIMRTGTLYKLCPYGIAFSFPSLQCKEPQRLSHDGNLLTDIYICLSSSVKAIYISFDTENREFDSSSLTRDFQQ